MTHPTFLPDGAYEVNQSNTYFIPPPSSHEVFVDSPNDIFEETGTGSILSLIGSVGDTVYDHGSGLNLDMLQGTRQLSITGFDLDAAGVITIQGSQLGSPRDVEGHLFSDGHGGTMLTYPGSIGYLIDFVDTTNVTSDEILVSSDGNTVTILGHPMPPPTPTPTPPPAPTPPFLIDDTTTGAVSAQTGTAYSGPVPGLTSQIIDITTDNLNITAQSPNVFIKTGSGEDAIDVSKVNGNNVLDGSTGSNFLVGGTGNDTFFVDDRGPTSTIWSTVAGFHAGDSATVFGVTQAGFGLSWIDGQGAAGYTGATLYVTQPGKPTAELTLAGYTTADLSSGKLTATFGTEGDGTPYMLIQGH